MTTNPDPEPEPELPDPYPMRQTCPCGSQIGRLSRVGAGIKADCSACGQYVYWVPKAELGLAPEPVSTRKDIKPSQRARVLERDGHRCVLCGHGPGEGAILHLGHLLSVEDAAALGVPPEDVKDDENLAAMCAECNLGIGRGSVPARLVAALVHHRAARARAEGAA
jgi:hypothetical protein